MTPCINIARSRIIAPPTCEASRLSARQSQSGEWQWRSTDSSKRPEFRPANDPSEPLLNEVRPAPASRLQSRTLLATKLNVMADMTILASPKTEVARVPTSWLARLRSSAFVRNAGTLSAGTALGHAFTLAAAPVLTRIYGPGDFGAFGLFLSFMSVAGDAVTLRFEASIVSGRDESEVAHLTLASLLLALPLSVLAGMGLWGLIHFSVLGFGTLPWYSPLLVAVALCSFGVFNT